MPDDLPELTQIEEMLIARVYPFVEIRSIRGQQYRWSGLSRTASLTTTSGYRHVEACKRGLEPSDASSVPQGLPCPSYGD
jgi:hypothetical protein